MCSSLAAFPRCLPGHRRDSRSAPSPNASPCNWRGSAAKSLEMKRYAKVEPSRRTGNISTNLPDEQETNLPDERDTTFPANGNPLSYEASYEGVVVVPIEAANLELYIAADFETGELLEAPPDDGRRDLSDAELDGIEASNCPVIFDDWYVNSTAGAFEADSVPVSIGSSTCR